MSATLQRKLHSFQEILHNAMVAIPFFYSSLPTKILAIRNVPIEILQSLQTPIHQKLYYKNNTPVVTYLMEFETLQKAIDAHGRIVRQMSSKPTKYVCEFSKSVIEYNGILFVGGNNYVTFPSTKQLKEVIDKVSQTVVMSGVDFQQSLKSVQAPMLAFLNEQIMSLEHMYYRWRVYSYMQGDGDKKYRIEPFQIVENGFTWFPPISQSHNPYPLVMNLKQTKYFTECLQKMERRKYAIEEAMIFALHNINYAVHISLIILIQLHDSLKSDFIGIMYLISDILFNSQNHIYRNLFQSRLPYFIDTYLTLRQTNEAPTINDKFFIQLKKLLEIWEKRFVFDQNFLKGLLFLLKHPTAQDIQELSEISQHPKTRQIFGADHHSHELQKNCKENGIPFFQSKEYLAKIYLNALFWQNERANQVEPDLGRYDGEAISEKELQKIQSKTVKVVSCQNLPLSMLFQKSCKPLKTFYTSVSQDGA